MGRDAVLVEFWDFARINSLRTLPYLRTGTRATPTTGLRVIGVHSPGYSFGRDPELVARAVERLGVPYAVLLDPDLEVWRLYGNRGWPGRYLFDRARHARASSTTARASTSTPSWRSGECLGDRGRARLPSRCVAEDAPGVLLEPQTADIAPAARPRAARAGARLDRRRGLDRGRDAGAAASFSYAAARPTRCCQAPTSSRASTRRTGVVVAETPACACTASVHARAARARPDLLREHEAHVLLDHLELGDVLGAARAEELHQALDQLLGRAGAGA